MSRSASAWCEALRQDCDGSLLRGQAPDQANCGCGELQVAPSTHYAAKTRPASARDVRDAALVPIVGALWSASRKIYGVRKLWKAARRAGHDLGRDQVARLMRAAGIEGRRKGKKRRRQVRGLP